MDRYFAKNEIRMKRDTNHPHIQHGLPPQAISLDVLKEKYLKNGETSAQDV